MRGNPPKPSYIALTVLSVKDRSNAVWRSFVSFTPYCTCLLSVEHGYPACRVSVYSHYSITLSLHLHGKGGGVAISTLGLLEEFKQLVHTIAPSQHHSGSIAGGDTTGGHLST
jgi:hypothetical protein